MRYKTILKPITMGNNIFSRTLSAVLFNYFESIRSYTTLLHPFFASTRSTIYRRSFNFLEITKLIITKIIQFSIQFNCVLIRLSILTTWNTVRKRLRTIWINLDRCISYTKGHVCSASFSAGRKFSWHAWICTFR